MSHFYAIALVPADTKPKKLEEAVGKLMEPYSEGLEVAPYIEDCYCVGNDAQIAAREGANKALDTDMSQLRERFQKEISGPIIEKLDPKPETPWDLPEEVSMDLDAKWTAFCKPYNDKIAELDAAHPMHKKPKPDCEECEGKGKVTSTRNPNGNWDWYVVGGRWDGVIKKLEVQSEDKGFNFGDKHHQPKNNTILVSELLSNFKKEDAPFALITPDGKWHQKGRMLMFGMTDGEKKKEEWYPEVRALLEKYADHLAVGLDCHT